MWFMESWASEFSKMMQAIAEEMEQFITAVAKDVEVMVDEFIEASEDFVEQLEAAISPDLDQSINDFFDPILEAYLGFDFSMDDTAQPFIHTVDPLVNEHPACVGCRHYHGQAYNGVMLVCGMHPYGWESEECPDWQSTWDN